MSLQVPRSGDRPPDAISSQIAELAPWFHNLHLPSGHQTARSHPLGDFPAFKWEQIADVLDTDLGGVRALDVGCNAGFYSFALAARGAEVLAIDVDEHYLRQGRWAAEQLDPHGRVRFARMHLYDLFGAGERFDLILFLGVLYHLRYPQLALDLLSELTGGRMIVQTLTMPQGGDPGRAARTPGDASVPAGPAADSPVPADLPFDQRARLAEPGWPKAAFIERCLAGDQTNWWAPDDACVQAMLRSAGLRVVAAPAHETYVCERDAERDPARPLREAELSAAMGRAYSSQRK